MSVTAEISNTPFSESLLRSMLVHNGPWLCQAISYLRLLPPGLEGTGEQLKIRVCALGCPEPHHYNLWGGLMRHALTRGLIAETGRSVPRIRTGGGHFIPIYRRTRDI